MTDIDQVVASQSILDTFAHEETKSDENKGLPAEYVLFYLVSSTILILKIINRISVLQRWVLLERDTQIGGNYATFWAREQYQSAEATGRRSAGLSQ